MVGVANTAIHWIIFGLAFFALGLDQAVSNLLAFVVAVTFSFFANAKFTFNEKATGTRYLMFVAFMGAMSFIVGLISDNYSINPLVTLIAFSSISLALGFLYSRFLVFRVEEL